MTEGSDNTAFDPGAQPSGAPPPNAEPTGAPPPDAQPPGGWPPVAPPPPPGVGWQAGSDQWRGAGFNAGTYGGSYPPPFGQAGGYGPGYGPGGYGPGAYGAGGYGPGGTGGYGGYGPGAGPWARQPTPPWIVGDGVDKLVGFLVGLFLNIVGMIGTIVVMYLWAGNSFGPQDDADRREHANRCRSGPASGAWRRRSSSSCSSCSRSSSRRHGPRRASRRRCSVGRTSE